MDQHNDVMDQSDDKVKISIDDILDNRDNVAELLSETLLENLGNQVLDDYTLDRDSMEEWLCTMEAAIKLASQKVTAKSEPWVGAANVKHALILEACIQFSSRAMPELFRDGKIAKSKVVGADPDKQKFARAGRVEKYMNHQLFDEMDDWDEGLDRLLQVLSMMGTVFKKTYYCSVSQQNKSELCLPDKITLHQSTQSLKSARRITHEITLFASDVEERIRAGVFLSEDYDEVQEGDQPFNDQELIFLEQHRLLDLDGDGYPEPYIVTIHETSKKVARIVPRFTEKSITYNDELEIAKIDAEQFFSDFHFIHSIDGTFFSYGFGYLLSHATNTINTLLNQIIDAGSLDNLQSGFYGKGARIKGGKISFKPGQWIKADASGVDLKNSIVPLPTKGPSNVLLSLVQFLLDSYYRMVSISDIMSGQVSGSNTTAAEAMAAVEQGMKVMGAVYKRIYRGLRKELKQLYRLNSEYLPEQTYFNVMDSQEAIARSDFEQAGVDILPIADASMSTQLEEITKLRTLVEMLPMIPEMDRRALGRRILVAMRIEDIDQIIQPVDQNQPTPQQQEIAESLNQQADQLQAQERELAIKEGELKLKFEKGKYEIMKLMADAALAAAKAESEGADLPIKEIEAKAKVLTAQASWKQAITPDSGGSKNDNERTT